MNFIEEISAANFVKVVCSNPFNKNCKYRKISLRNVTSKNRTIVQAEKFTATQAFHENIDLLNLTEWCENNLLGVFKQIVLFYSDKTVSYLFSNKGSVKRLEKSYANVVNTDGAPAQTHNNVKNYILKEGAPIPAFVDLGVFTKDYKVVQSMYSKFRQINRFVEILDDMLKTYDEDEITVLDFGCGKSYLTFFIYYYLTEVKKIKAKIIGYDLKSEVVENCNRIAQKYGYKDLQFIVADVSKDKLYGERIDMVVSLHACDTATDYALHYAVTHDVKYILSVPCCQHEVNLSIQNGGEMDILLRYGIVKERASALLTDSVRALLLEDEGYSVDILEFVDMDHSLKNLMIRAKSAHAKRSVNRAKIEDLMQKYRFSHTLYKLLYSKTK